MKRVFVVRTAIIGAGAFGVMFNDAMEPIAVTIEKTFDSGQPLLQPGVYNCWRRIFHRGGYMTFEILVAGHTDVLFHKANVEKDLEGCIGVATSFTLFGEVPGVADSKHGFDKFWETYKDETDIELVVSNTAISSASASL